ncbi:MAG: rubrerythrin family protein [Oscillibacter sp.]|nr:rubrerythrin family protein [Oscillibacter sp.]
MNLSESHTLVNLMRAFAGESQARNRYTFAAGVCKQQKLHLLEAVFNFTADQEKEHAEIFYNHMKDLAGSTVAIDGSYPIDLTNEVSQLLRRAEHNELEEFEDVYPAFAKTAEEEGFPAIAHSFREIAKIEQTHAKRFAWLAQALEEGTLYAGSAKQAWMCLNCGYIVNVMNVPAKCPVCDHDQGYFVPLALAPYSSEQMLP